MTRADRSARGGEDASLDEEVRSAVDRTREALVETRRRLHARPELAFEERSTAELVAARCEELGYATTTGVAGSTGVLADLDSGRAGPRVLLRADMDALPIREQGGERAVTSTVPGVMHACGHDGHVAILLGAGAALGSLRDRWRGSLRLCFQPAEEVASGAAPMIEAGALEGVAQVFGLHLWAPLQVGRVGVTAGPIFGSTDEFRITVRGRGGHGGMPHTSIDPIPATAAVITALQTVVSRETSPFSPAVLTIGRLEGGAAYNVIAEEVRLRGTVRALSADDRERLLRRTAELAAGVAAAHRCEARFERGVGCPPVVNDEHSVELVRAAAVATVGDENVDVAEPLTVGDDMSLFLEGAPGCYFLVGAGDVAGRPVAPHHHPEFDIDERSLPIGAETLVRAALAVLERAQ